MIPLGYASWSCPSAFNIQLHCKIWQRCSFRLLKWISWSSWSLGTNRSLISEDWSDTRKSWSSLQQQPCQIRRFIILQHICSQKFQYCPDSKLYAQCNCHLVPVTIMYYSRIILLDMFLVVTSSYIHWFLWLCQVNNWISNTCFVIGVQGIFISDKVTNRVTKCWLMDNWLLWQRLYWKTAAHFLIWQRC